MGTSANRLIEIVSLFTLVAVSLWLTAFAVYGSVISILLLLALVLGFAAAKEPYRTGFLYLVLLSGLFISNPIEIKLKHADRVTVKLLPITYGLPGPDLRKHAEQDEVVAGGCVVTPFSPHWRVLVVVH